MKLSNRQIGSIGVAKVTTALLQLGYSVLTPSEDCNGYDIVAEKDGKFNRIQVKCSTKQDRKYPRYAFMTSKGNHGKQKYTKSSCDWIVCIGLEDDLYWVFPPSGTIGKSKKCMVRTGSNWKIVGTI